MNPLTVDTWNFMQRFNRQIGRKTYVVAKTTFCAVYEIRSWTSSFMCLQAIIACAVYEIRSWTSSFMCLQAIIASKSPSERYQSVHNWSGCCNLAERILPHNDMNDHSISQTRFSTNMLLVGAFLLRKWSRLLQSPVLFSVSLWMVHFLCTGTVALCLFTIST